MARREAITSTNKANPMIVPKMIATRSLIECPFYLGTPSPSNFKRALYRYRTSSVFLSVFSPQVIVPGSSVHLHWSTFSNILFLSLSVMLDPTMNFLRATDCIVDVDIVFQPTIDLVKEWTQLRLTGHLFFLNKGKWKEIHILC